MSITNEFNDAVADANEDVTDQINAAQDVIDIGEDANYFLDILAGGDPNSRDRLTMDVVQKTVDMLGDDIDIESFIDTPTSVDFLLDDVPEIEPVRIRGSFTLPQFWDQIFASGTPMGAYRQETATRVETAVIELRNWYATIDEANDPAYENRVAEARRSIAELTPIRDQLRAGSDRERARGLQAYDPNALGVLLDTPEGTRTTQSDTELRETLAGVDSVPPRTRRPATFSPQQRRRLDALRPEETEEPEEEPASNRRIFQLPPSERLDTMGPRPELTPEIKSANVRNRILREQRAYDAEVERRTRLEERLAAQQMRSDAIARVGEPGRLEQARLRFISDRERGQGNARESFEQGMALLRQQPDDVPTSPSSPVPGRATRTPRGLGREATGTGSAFQESVSDRAGEMLVDGASANQQRARFEQAMYGIIPGDGDGDGGEETTTPTYRPGPTAAQIRDANQAEVELLLAQQFGGFSFFLQKHRSDLQVGLTADGQVVRADDPNAATVKNILDVIVDQGITAPTRVLGLLENTEWWQTTDARMREYDVLTADMSEPQKLEYLEPVLDNLRDEAQFLGFQLDPTRARDLAEQITRMGEETDAEVIRGMLVAESAFNAAEVTASSFAAARDEIVAMSKRYFAPINEDVAAEYAQNIYVGTQTAEGVEQMFREQAAINYPQLQNALNAGITPEQYFAPYKYEIERMLDRPNVDLYEEFGDVVQFIPDTGTGEARPMTLGEVRKYVRGLDEWQQSSQGKDSARALAFSIGRTFGEVA